MRSEISLNPAATNVLAYLLLVIGLIQNALSYAPRIDALGDLPERPHAPRIEQDVGCQRPPGFSTRKKMSRSALSTFGKQWSHVLRGGGIEKDPPRTLRRLWSAGGMTSLRIRTTNDSAPNISNSFTNSYLTQFIGDTSAAASNRYQMCYCTA